MGDPSGSRWLARDRHRVLLAVTLSAMLFMPLAPVLGGVALSAWGGGTTMLGAAVLTALSVVPLLESRDVRTLPTPFRWPVRAAEPEPQQSHA